MLDEHVGFARSVADYCASGLGQRLSNRFDPPGIPSLGRCDQASLEAAVAVRASVLVDLREFVGHAEPMSAGAVEGRECCRKRWWLVRRCCIGKGFMSFGPKEGRVVRIAQEGGPLLAHGQVGDTDSGDLVEYVIADPVTVVRGDDQRWRIHS